MACLVAQTRRQGVVAGQDLQCNGLAGREIVTAIDLAHAAAAGRADDSVSRPLERARRDRAVTIPLSTLCERRGVGNDAIAEEVAATVSPSGEAPHAAYHGVRRCVGAADCADHRALLS